MTERPRRREPRELWFVGPGVVEVRRGLTPPALVPGEVRVQAICSGVSQGTELLLYRGEAPREFDPSLDIRGQKADAPTYPRRYGYSWVGEVVESRVHGIEEGQRVFALQPHGDEHVLQLEQARLLPPELPSTRCVLAANMETALTVVWDAGVALGDRVVVLGGGLVGLLCAHLCQLAGADLVRLVEPLAKRRKAALDIGIVDVVTPEASAGDVRADVVIEATGNPACLDQAIACAGHEATITVASFYGERRSPVALGTDFHRRRLHLRASQVSSLPPHKAPRWDLRRRFAKVLTLLADSRLDHLIEPSFPFAEAASLYARLASDPGSALQTVFTYD